MRALRMQTVVTFARMTWSSLVFLHWDVAPSAIASWVPPWLTLDRRRGRAFVGVVALRTRGPVLPLPWPAVRRMPEYAQVNVRTYVNGPHGPGVLLRRTSVASAIAAAGARLIGQPYVAARTHVTSDGMRVEVESAPLSFEGTAIEERSRPAEDVERWLVNRFVVYGELPGGIPYHVRIRHGAWRVRRMSANVCETRVPELGGARPGGILLADPVDVDMVGALPERLPSLRRVFGLTEAQR